jgi:hypothetical protein
MKFTRETIDRILRTLNERTAETPEEFTTCSFCGHHEWTASEGYVFLAVQDEPPNNIRLGGRGLPLFPLTCTTCGNTLFFNLMVLGLGDLLKTDEKTETEERSAKETSVKQ